jgi:hypothetical protein
MNEPKAGLLEKGHSERHGPPLGPALLWVLLCLVRWLWARGGPRAAGPPGCWFS